MNNKSLALGDIGKTIVMLLLILLVALWIWVAISVVYGFTFEMTPELTKETAILEQCIMYHLETQECFEIYGDTRNVR